MLNSFISLCLLTTPSPPKDTQQTELPAPENLIEEAARAFRLVRVLPSPCCFLAGSEQKAHACCQRTFHWGVLVGSKGLLLLLRPPGSHSPNCLLQP